MQSYISLENIRLYAYHGVFPQETKVGNNFVIDIKVKVNVVKATESDSLNDTVSYATIYEIIKREMEIPSKLIEHVAGRIISALKSELPQIEKVELKLSKLTPPFGGQVESASIILID